MHKKGYWKTYSKKYYQKNKEKCDEHIKRWREKNKDKVKQYSKKWRDNHKEYVNCKTKEWEVNHKYNLTISEYKKITKKCHFCDWKHNINCHHLIKGINKLENYVGLCPNHHKLIHTNKFKDKLTKELKNFVR